MTVFLPLFPLSLVAFPDEDLNLHIFEPRYKQLVAECEHRGTTFGIPAFINDKISSIGTELELVSVERRYTNGNLDIKTKGKGIFEIKEFFKEVKDRLYSGAEVQRMESSTQGDFEKYRTIFGYVQELYQILNIKKPLPDLNGEFSTYKVAHVVGFNIEEEYKLLTIPDETTRQDFMIKHLERLIPTAREMEVLRKKVQMNGHFKNVLPPDF